MEADLQKKLDQAHDRQQVARKIYLANLCGPCVADFSTPKPLCGPCEMKASLVTMVLRSVPLEFCDDCGGVHA